MTHRIPLVSGVVAIGVFAVASAQGPAFDVASVRQMASAAPFMQLTMQPGGRLVARNVSPRLLIRTAFGIEDYQLVGAPGWLETTRYEVDAVAGREVSRDEALAMLRALLADRFMLRTHNETRQLSIYELHVQDAGRLGPQLRRSGPECAPVTFPAGVPSPPPPPPAAAGGVRGDTFELGVGAPLMCPSMFGVGWVSARRVTIPQFVMRLSPLAGRPVVDRTGLDDVFDIDMSYAPELATVPPAAGAPPAPAGGASDLPSLVTAIREQLGLRLEPARGAVAVLVVESVERPTEN